MLCNLLPVVLMGQLEDRGNSGTQLARFEAANGKRGGLAGEASAEKGLGVGSWGPLTCSRYQPSTQSTF